MWIYSFCYLLSITFFNFASFCYLSETVLQYISPWTHSWEHSPQRMVSALHLMLPITLLIHCKHSSLQTLESVSISISLKDAKVEIASLDEAVSKGNCGNALSHMRGLRFSLVHQVSALWVQRMGKSDFRFHCIWLTFGISLKRVDCILWSSSYPVLWSQSAWTVSY